MGSACFKAPLPPSSQSNAPAWRKDTPAAVPPTFREHQIERLKEVSKTSSTRTERQPESHRGAEKSKVQVTEEKLFTPRKLDASPQVLRSVSEKVDIEEVNVNKEPNVQPQEATEAPAPAPAPETTLSTIDAVQPFSSDEIYDEAMSHLRNASQVQQRQQVPSSSSSTP
eukprot:CAMPEP_0184366140 /NCGR_PEP_ID=MMETSP1089-20130417/152323_1 /TAXON_ID=38269 ORGANISM="Gloeochaete wittrockiana, Strain SAG46.84" /NCGR_SAMPLE_ID=MMETSP1089 /ASSEMBLY_ACC=CAM_ASM_000445 /LENGTH=168 /DNA_ID=CAMNT_0026707629 /DNA_START=132 /DNA_END=634 /DNA_ORIENTATION=+